jgi:glycosyltransferase involved in cell wall biosynthesis/predicted DCC family thiol-disulfide oxidoreductase YuxK
VSTTQQLNRPCDVSIVVSTHNRADMLRQCVEALEHQDSGPWSYEIIIVDNASTDGTAGVIADLLAHGAPILALREPRAGVSHGRNTGVGAARGRIVAFTDDDIRVAPDWVSRIARAFEDEPGVECIGGPVRPLWSARPPAWLDRRHWSPLSVTDYGDEPFEINADHPRCLLTSNMAFRRAALDRIGGFSPEFPRSQDHELQIRFWLNGGRARYVPDLVVHTVVPESRMRADYHRGWHVRHGRMCARMQLRERTRPDGGLRHDIPQPHLVASVPAFLWRELAEACRAWCASWASGQRGTRLDREMRVRHLAGYIAEVRTLAAKRSAPTTPERGGARPPGRLAGDGSPTRERYTMLFDGSCGLCATTVRVVGRLDALRRIEALDVAGDWPSVSARFPTLSRDKCLDEIHVVTPDGGVRTGFSGCRSVAWAIPAAWPLLPLLHLPGATLVGDRVYRLVARRRFSQACAVDSSAFRPRFQDPPNS